MGKIITVSGPRGCGKSTILRELIPHGIAPIAPFTTRPLRADEQEGLDYRHVSIPQFEEIAAQSPMFDVLDLGAKKYGTPHAELARVIESDQVRTFNVAANTALNLRAYYGRVAVTSVILLPTRWDDIRMQMRLAGIAEEEINERIANEPTDLRLLPKFDEIVINQFGETAHARDRLLAIAHPLGRSTMHE